MSHGLALQAVLSGLEVLAYATLAFLLARRPVPRIMQPANALFTAWWLLTALLMSASTVGSAMAATGALSPSLSVTIRLAAFLFGAAAVVVLVGFGQYLAFGRTHALPLLGIGYGIVWLALVATTFGAGPAAVVTTHTNFTTQFEAPLGPVYVAGVLFLAAGPVIVGAFLVWSARALEGMQRRRAWQVGAAIVAWTLSKVLVVLAGQAPAAIIIAARLIGVAAAFVAARAYWSTEVPRPAPSGA